MDLLSPEDADALVRDVTRFLAWLSGRLRADASSKYGEIVFTGPDNSDWVMEVPNTPNEPVKFNIAPLKDCSVEYYRMIIIHECFHLLVQDVPNKIDAKRLKDDFGDTLMLFMDVEADFYTYLFLEFSHNYDGSKIFQLNFQGREVFGDERTRIPKLERFVSSALTMVNHFANQCSRDKEIFLVRSINIATENTLHALVFTSTHCESRKYQVSNETWGDLVSCYERKIDTAEKYSSTVIECCTKIISERHA